MKKRPEFAGSLTGFVAGNSKTRLELGYWQFADNFACLNANAEVVEPIRDALIPADRCSYGGKLIAPAIPGSGGSEDPLALAGLNHLLAVNQLLGWTNRVALTSRRSTRHCGVQ